VERADEFFKVLEVGDLAEGEGCVVQAGIKKIALFRVDGQYHAIQNHCPHAGGFLGLGDLSGTQLVCPRHAWVFDVASGNCLSNPRYCVKQYRTRLEDGWVLVGVPDDGKLM